MGRLRFCWIRDKELAPELSHYHISGSRRDYNYDVVNGGRSSRYIWYLFNPLICGCFCIVAIISSLITIWKIVATCGF